MALRLVRQTSETPNITNKDDTIMARYAYGGYNGVVKAFGNECDYKVESGIFTIKDGRIVVDGWEIDIYDKQVLDFTYAVGTQYHSIFLTINVATETTNIDKVFSQSVYPQVLKGDDLTSVPNGTANLLLYNVRTENGTITEVIKKFEIIPYLAKKVLESENELKKLNKSLIDGTLKPKIALYASEDTSKGTIEERLTKLGFNPGSMSTEQSDGDITLTKNIVNRQGNYVIGELFGEIKVKDIGNKMFVLGVIPNGFRPGKMYEYWVGVELQLQITEYVRATMILDSNGAIYLQLPKNLGSAEVKLRFAINFGFDATAV
jgi:hypothetical protein